MIYRYDGSYEGLLSCVFHIFKNRMVPTSIQAEVNCQDSLLDQVVTITTNDEWALRVINGLDKLAAAQASALIYKLFLSELPDNEMLVYQVVYALLHKGDGSVLENFANPAILKAAQIEKMIHREVHRMHAFVRFQKSQGGLFYAAIDPDFNVLPLLGDHFERRYADQPWLIFDTRRHYGLHFDGKSTVFIEANAVVGDVSLISVQDEVLQDEREKEFQLLWKNYFHAVNIQERNNKKLHLRHMPKRYWKYLIEKH